MSNFLPRYGFKWIDPKKLYSINTAAIVRVVVFLEVDLEYPKELHQLHNDYPLAPDKIEIKEEMLSNYQLQIADFYDIPIGNVTKLVPNFFVKEKYVLNCEIL